MLKETGFKYVLFALNRHNNFFDTHEMIGIMQSLGHSRPVACLGGYNGQTECSFMTTTEALDAFIAHPRGYELISAQESFLLVSECNKAYAALFYPFFDGLCDPVLEHVGSMHDVTRNEALANPAGWTYRCDTKNWYVTKKSNPDRTPPPQGWPTKERQRQIKRYHNSLRVATLRARSSGEERGLRELQAFLAEQYGVA